jgi:hypothetical protein
MDVKMKGAQMRDDHLKDVMKMVGQMRDDPMMMVVNYVDALPFSYSDFFQLF